MSKSIAELLDARDKADKVYANVLSRLKSISREATIARRARSSAHRQVIIAICRKEHSK